ncbi:MAG: IS21 family transposase [Bdellovibrionales bacterium]|nr:IS21 family transposase [Bdellovibrionales bacterium]
MIRLEEWMDIKQMHHEGKSIREISKETGRARNTVRKVLKQKAPEKYKMAKRATKIDPHQEYIKTRYEESGVSAIRMHEEIKQMGYVGSLRSLRRYMQTLKQKKKSLQNLTVRFETPPGKQAQVDWAHCGQFTNEEGKKVNIYGFVMVLSYSRKMYVRFVTQTKIHELMECHLKAFEYYGGWPESILYDNMKQVRINPNKWNPLFLDFCQYYGIIPKTHQPYRPRTKGKVERMVYYLKDNFLRGRTFNDLADLNQQAMHWLNHTANQRKHSTTGCKPEELFKQEQLIPIRSISVYPLQVKQWRKVDQEGYVQFNKSRYSVPPENVGQEVVVEQDDQIIRIKYADVIIAEHPKAQKINSCLSQEEHVQALWKLSLGKSEVQPIDWKIKFNSSDVEVRSLSKYDEVAV